MKPKCCENYFLSEEISEHCNKRLVLVIYDITDNKRRNKFVKFLEGYGTRVQKSAFEMIVDDKQYKEILKKVPFYIGNDDNVRVYKLKISGEVVSWGSAVTEPEEIIII